MRYFVAGGGCYGSYYVRQLDRARSRGLLEVSEIIVVDKNPHCAVSAALKDIKGASLVKSSWEAFGKEIIARRGEWVWDHWVPTPIGPHIIYEWFLAETKERTREPYKGSLPSLPYSAASPKGSLVLSHAPGLCPTNCVEPKICPLTHEDRDWEMADTVRKHLAGDRDIEGVGVFLCQHHAYGVGTIPLKMVYEEWDQLTELWEKGAKRLAIATVSSCHGIVDLVGREVGPVRKRNRKPAPISA